MHLRILHFFLWTVSGQGRPPNWGSSLTIRDRIMWPFPQDLLHSDHPDHSDSMQSVAGGGMEWIKKTAFHQSVYFLCVCVYVCYSRHSGSMHFSTCSSSSGHRLGSTGVFSMRWRERMPTPQDTLHSPQSDHGDSIHTTASTHTGLIECYYFFMFLLVLSIDYNCFTT